MEITNPGYETKDLLCGPPLYLANGDQDVVVLHRATGEIHHTTRLGTRRLRSPATLTLTCGCAVTL